MYQANQMGKFDVMKSEHDDNSITPVCLLTGFLGSGKTTLLNHWLTSENFSNVAVIVNEFGDIGIDHALIVRSDDRTIELSNGCLCCTVSGDLVNTLRELLVKRSSGQLKWFDKILIETTGLADPSQLVQVFMTMPVARKYFLSKVITVIDGVQGEDSLTRFPEAVRQLAIADYVVISKNDMQECFGVNLAARIKEINPGAKISLSSSADWPTFPDLFEKHMRSFDDPEHILKWLNAASYEKKSLNLMTQAEGASEKQYRHSNSLNVRDIHSFSLSFSEALHWEHVSAWLDALVIAHAKQLLRVKGILRISGCDKPIVFQAVQQLFHPPVELDSWPINKPFDSRIVFITQGLTQEYIEEVLSVITSRAASPIN